MALLPIERDRWIELLRSDIPTFNAELAAHGRRTSYKVRYVNLVLGVVQGA